jgi:hypothetical protein
MLGHSLPNGLYLDAGLGRWDVGLSAHRHHHLARDASVDGQMRIASRPTDPKD